MDLQHVGNVVILTMNQHAKYQDQLVFFYTTRTRRWQNVQCVVQSFINLTAVITWHVLDVAEPSAGFAERILVRNITITLILLICLAAKDLCKFHNVSFYGS